MIDGEKFVLISYLVSKDLFKCFDLSFTEVVGEE